MYLFVLVLNQKEQLNKILEKFMEIGIAGATVLDSKGLGQAVMECESPVVGGLRNLLYNQCRPTNNTLFSVVENRETINQAIVEVEKIIGPLGEPGTGIAFTISLDFVKGFNST